MVKGFRYDQGDATSNDQQLKAQVVDPIEKKLIEAFGAPEFGERVSRHVGIETMLMLSEDENFKSGRQRGGSEDGSADHGTPLFPWSISWIYPPLPAADAGEE